MCPMVGGRGCTKYGGQYGKNPRMQYEILRHLMVLSEEKDVDRDHFEGDIYGCDKRCQLHK